MQFGKRVCFIKLSILFILGSLLTGFKGGVGGPLPSVVLCARLRRPSSPVLFLLLHSASEMNPK